MSATDAPVAIPGLELGKQFRDLGIYMGIHEPKDEEGNSTGPAYHLFASDQLRDLRTFNETAAHVGTLPEGLKVENPVSYRKEVEKAMADGSIDGKQFIPLLEMMTGGRDAEGNKIRSENMLDMRDLKDFKKYFAVADGSNSCLWGFSCTEHHSLSASVWSTDITDGCCRPDHLDTDRANCFLVRAVAVNRLAPNP
jgi:hypothetical protein